MSVFCECCVLSGIGLCDGLIPCPEESYGCLSSRVLCRGLCDELISRPEESYRLWFVVVCDLETS